MALSPIGKCLRTIRSSREMKLITMSDEIGLSAGHLSSIETGRREPPDDFYDRILEKIVLTKEEQQSLRDACDVSPSTVKIKPSNEQEAKFASLLSRNIGNIDPEQLSFMSELINQRPVVRNSTRLGLEFRRMFVKDGEKFDPIHVLELQFPKLEEEVFYDIVDDLGGFTKNNAGKIVESNSRDSGEGRVEYDPIERTFRIMIPETVYVDAARNEDGGSLFSICHELAHALLHRHVLRHRALKSRKVEFLDRGDRGSGRSFNKEDASFELQANEAAAAMMITPQMARANNERQSAMRFKVSRSVHNRMRLTHDPEQKKGQEEWKTLASLKPFLSA